MCLMKLQSPRLRLRPIVHDDVDNIHALLSLPETDRYNALGIPEDLNQTKRWVADWLSWMEKAEAPRWTLVVTSIDRDEFIGLYGVSLAPAKYSRAELWYKLHPHHWGQGYATELSRAVISHGFESLRLHRIEAGVAVDNAASIRVLEKCGMIREGKKRQNLPLSTGFSDSYHYAILCSDYLAQS